MTQNPKIISWAFLGWLAALLGSMSTILVFVGWLVRPHIDEYIINVHNEYEKTQEDPLKKSFRDLLSEETGIPNDRIHIKFGEWWNDHIKFESILEDILPVLEEEVTCIIPRLIIMTNKRAKWLHRDGEFYDASIGNDGFFWFYHPTDGWLPCRV